MLGLVIAGPGQGICISVCAPAITLAQLVIAGALGAAGAVLTMCPPPRERPGAGGAAAHIATSSRQGHGRPKRPGLHV